MEKKIGSKELRKLARVCLWTSKRYTKEAMSYPLGVEREFAIKQAAYYFGKYALAKELSDRGIL